MKHMNQIQTKHINMFYLGNGAKHKANKTYDILICCILGFRKAPT